MWMFIVLKQHYEIFWLQILMWRMDGGWCVCAVGAVTTTTSLLAIIWPSHHRKQTHPRQYLCYILSVVRGLQTILKKITPCSYTHHLYLSNFTIIMITATNTQPQTHSVSLWSADIHSSHWKHKIKNDKCFELHFSSWRCRCLHFQCTQVSKRKLLLHI